MQKRINRTPAQEAEYLNTSIRTLARWRNQGMGPAYVRAGGKVLYPSDLTEEWLERKTVEPVREAG